MAKVSIVKQFEAKIRSIAPVKSIERPKRGTNRRGNLEYKTSVVFEGHEKNEFRFYWDSEADYFLVCRSEIHYTADGTKYCSELLADPAFYLNGTLAEVGAFIKAHWDDYRIEKAIFQKKES